MPRLRICERSGQDQDKNPDDLMTADGLETGRNSATRTC